MLAVPANANSCMTRIWLYPNRIAVTFWRPANENFSSDSSGVCWIDNSRSRPSPRNANRSTRRMPFWSNVSFRRCRSPVKASVGRYVKLFLVSDRWSTVLGKSRSGTNVRCPELQRIWNRTPRVQTNVFHKLFPDVCQNSEVSIIYHTITRIVWSEYLQVPITNNSNRTTECKIYITIRGKLIYCIKYCIK